MNNSMQKWAKNLNITMGETTASPESATEYTQ